MKKNIVFILLLIASFAHAQPVVRKVIAEHFTNTHCSICASQNPGFYMNLSHYPQVLHIAYHPSAPYPTCPLNLHNVTENDARTNFYGVYGSTPRVVINGTALTAANSLTDSNIFVSRFGQFSAYAISLTLQPKGNDSMTIRAMVRKMSADNATTLQLYGAVAEDTLFFNAANGESQHYDVFRKAVWGASPIAITAPANQGDSVVYMKNIWLNSLWKRQRMYAIAVLQDSNNKVVQAERSGLLPAVTTGIGMVTGNDGLFVYPNPATDLLYVENGLTQDFTVSVTDVYGRKLIADKHPGASGVLDITALPAGNYFLFVNDRQQKVLRFIKN